MAAYKQFPLFLTLLFTRAPLSLGIGSSRLQTQVHKKPDMHTGKCALNRPPLLTCVGVLDWWLPRRKKLMGYAHGCLIRFDSCFLFPAVVYIHYTAGQPVVSE